MSKAKKRYRLTFSVIKKMIISIVLAVIVWVVITNAVNPEITVKIDNLPVKYTGEDILRSNGLVIVNKEDLPTFTVKISGTRSNILEEQKDIYVSIDVSSVTKTGMSIITPTVSVPKGISLEKKMFENVELIAESGVSKEIPIMVNQIYENDLPGKMIASVASENTVSVFGSKAEMGNVSACLVDVDCSKITEDGTSMYPYKYVDTDLNTVTKTSSIYNSYSAITVVNTIYDKYTVPITVTVNPMLQKMYVVNILSDSINPSNVDIGVKGGQTPPEQIMAEWNADVLMEGRINKTLDLNIPSNAYSKIKTVSFQADVEKKVIRTVPVSIKAVNLPDGLTIETNPSIVGMNVSMPESYTKEVTATVDMSGGVVGDNSVSVVFDDEKTEAADSNIVTVRLNKK